MKILLAALLLSFNAYADEVAYTSELVAKTDAGEIVLENILCEVPNPHGFNYRAYATDGAVVHAGCWLGSADTVSVWFYEEPDHPVATYGGYYFKPRGFSNVKHE
jgi:hypothetical protein